MSEDSKRILIYLADPIVLELTAFRLRMLGLSTVEVSDEQAMNDCLSEALPNLVIIDLDLSEGEGLRWIERIASDECLNHVPIICMSTEGDLQDAENAFKAGAREFLIVPYDPIELQDKIDHALAHPRRQDKEEGVQPAATT